MAWEDELARAIGSVPEPADDDELTRAIEAAAAPAAPAETGSYAPGRAWERFKAGTRGAAGALYPAPGQPGGPGGEYKTLRQRGLGLLRGLGEMAMPSILAGELAKPGLEWMTRNVGDISDEAMDARINAARTTLAGLSEWDTLAKENTTKFIQSLEAARALPYDERVKQNVAVGQQGIEALTGLTSGTQTLQNVGRSLGRRIRSAPARAAAEAVTETRAGAQPRPYQEPAQLIEPPVAGPQRPIDWVEPASVAEAPRVQRPTVLGETGRPLEPTMPSAVEVAAARTVEPKPMMIIDEFGRPIPQAYLIRQVENAINEIPDVVEEPARALRTAGEAAEEATGGRIAARPEADVTEADFWRMAGQEGVSAEQEIQRMLRGSVESPGPGAARAAGELPEGALRPGEEPFTTVPPKQPLEEYTLPRYRGLKAIAGGSEDTGWISPRGIDLPHGNDVAHETIMRQRHGMSMDEAFGKDWIRRSEVFDPDYKSMNLEFNAASPKAIENAIRYIQSKARGHEIRIDLNNLPDSEAYKAGKLRYEGTYFDRPWKAIEYLKDKLKQLGKAAGEETGAFFPSKEAREKAPRSLRELRGRQAEGPAPEVAPAQPLKTAREKAAARTEEIRTRPVDVGVVPNREARQMLRRGLPEQERQATEGLGETEGLVPGFNLKTINDPDDIKRIISGSAEGQRELIEGARGAKLTDETLKSLARESGLSPADLMKRHKETPFTPTEVVRYKNIIRASAQDIRAKLGDVTSTGSDAARTALKETLGRHAMIAGAFARGRAQVGRSLRAFQTIPDDTLDDIIPLLQQLDPENVAVISRVARRATNPTWWDKTMFVYINALLTSPVTHTVNAVSNTISVIGTPIEKLFQLRFGEAAYDAMGIAAAFKGGAMRSALRAHSTRIPTAGMERYTQRLQDLGVRMETPAHLESARRMPFTSESGKEFARIAGQPGNVLAASDDFFRSVIANGELYAQGLKEARKRGISGAKRDDFIKRFVESDATDEAILKAWNEAKYRTFNQKLGHVGSMMLALRKAEVGGTGIRPLEFLLPFVSTPTNIAKFALERSPLGFLASVSDLARGKFSREQFAKPLMGTAGLIFAYLGMEAIGGKITGRGPSDPAKREVWLQNHTPYSFELEWGGKRHTISFERIEPLATVLGGAADVAQSYNDVVQEGTWSEATVREKSAVVGKAMASVAKNLMNKTYFQQLTAITDALSDPNRFGERLLTSLTSAIQPVAGISSLARAADPYKRDVDPVTQPISELPFASRTLRPKLDPFGRPEERPGGASVGGFVQRFVSPAQVSTVGKDPLFRELERSGIGLGRNVRELPSGKRMDDEQFFKFEQVSGNLFRDKLADVVDSADYQDAETVEERKSLVSAAREEARREAREQLVEDGVLPEDALEPRALRGR